MKKEYDLAKLKKRPGKVKTDPEAAKIPISIRLDGGILADLRTEAERMGIPYQTFIGSILHRYVSGELLDPKATNIAVLKKWGT
jgi:predicted DNA binding CopG/RHH family protein